MKPGKLNDAEFAIMRMHPQLGLDLLHGLPGLDLEAQIVYSHHEALRRQWVSPAADRGSHSSDSQNFLDRRFFGRAYERPLLPAGTNAARRPR